MQQVRAGFIAIDGEDDLGHPVNREEALGPVEEAVLHRILIGDHLSRCAVGHAHRAREPALDRSEGVHLALGDDQRRAKERFVSKHILVPHALGAALVLPELLRNPEGSKLAVDDLAFAKEGDHQRIATRTASEGVQALFRSQRWVESPLLQF